jgi:hypothetical protein
MHIRRVGRGNRAIVSLRELLAAASNYWAAHDKESIVAQLPGALW